MLRFFDEILGITLLCFLVICVSLPSILSTLWISHKVNEQLQLDEGASTPNLEMKESSGTFAQKLQETLNNEQQCEAFIDWMYREFCSEVILSFLEFMQFRNYVKGEIKKTERDDIFAVNSDPFDFALYDGMPRSSIIHDPLRVTSNYKVNPSSSNEILSVPRDLESGTSHNEEPLTKCQRISHLLFKKYIGSHYAEHEINISGALRNKYVELEQKQYEEVDLEQFLTLYDEVIAEMMKYLAQSFRRFERAHQN